MFGLLARFDGRTIAVRARLAGADERERLWTRWLELQPSSQAFATLSGRAVPVFVFERRDERGPQRSSDSLT